MTKSPIKKETVTLKATVSWLIKKIVLLVVFARVHFVFHVVAVEIDPQQQNMTVGRDQISRRENGGGFLRSRFAAIMQANGGFVMPRGITALHQRGTVERA